MVPLVATKLGIGIRKDLLADAFDSGDPMASFSGDRD